MSEELMLMAYALVGAPPASIVVRGRERVGRGGRKKREETKKRERERVAVD